MESPDECPQIGPIDVPLEVLRASGESLADVLAELGYRESLDVPADAPPTGWRVLRRNEHSAALGAPLDRAGASWRIAQVRMGEAGGCFELRVHPDPQPRRVSRAERARGLELRWPAVTREDPDFDALAIDVVNTGTDRWMPAGDAFHVAGSIVRRGDAPADFLFGFVGGTNAALALDPGEYVRVRVVIPDGQWANLRPGPHDVRATLATLPVRAGAPLAVELTERLIERHRPKHPSTPPARDDHAAMRERLELLEVLLRATEHLPEVLSTLTDAADDETMRQRLAAQLECSEPVVRAFLEMQLRRFRPADARQLSSEAAALRRALAAVADPRSAQHEPG